MRRVAVLGAGASAFSAADTLVERGIDVRVFTEQVDPEFEALFQVIGAEPECILDAFQMLARVREFDPELIVVSPSIPEDHPVIRFARDEDLDVISEIELAWRLREPDGAEWVTVTGSGAVAVAELTEQFLRADGVSVLRLGYRSASVLDGIRFPDQPEYFLIVLTPQQLHYQDRVQPLVSASFSTDTSQSWHQDDQARLIDQAKVFQHTRQYAIYPRADGKIEDLLREADVEEGCRAIGFWLSAPGPSELGVVEDLIVDRAYHEDRRHSALEIVTLDEIVGAGFVTAEDITVLLAAITLARGLGVAPESIAALVQHWGSTPPKASS